MILITLDKLCVDAQVAGVVDHIGQIDQPIGLIQRMTSNLDDRRADLDLQEMGKLVVGGGDGQALMRLGDAKVRQLSKAGQLQASTNASTTCTRQPG